MKKTGIVLIIACCLAAAAPFNSYGSSEDLMPAAGVQAFQQDLKAPGFELQDLKGKKTALTDYHGKVVMLFFYATW